jgi:ATP-binding cassette subfamily B protein
MPASNDGVSPNDLKPNARGLKELRRIWPFFLRYRGAYLVGALALIGAVVLRISVPYLFGRSVDRLREAAENPSGPLQIGELAALVAWGALSIAAVALVGAVIRTSSRLLVLGSCRKAVHDLRNQLIQHLAGLSPSFFARQQTGKLMSRCVNDVQFVQSLLGPVFLYLSETAAVYIVSLSFMASISVKLTAIAIAPFPFFLWRAKYLAGQIQVQSRDSQESLAEVSAKVEESLSGNMVIRGLSLEGFDYGRFERCGKNYRDRNLDVTRTRARLGSLMTLLATGSTFVVMLIGGRMVVEKQISLGDFLATVFYLHLLVSPTAVLGFVISSLQRGAASLGRLGELFDEEPTLLDPPQGFASEFKGSSIRVRNLTIDLTNPNGQVRRVIDDVSFDVPAGTTLGVVGATGSGKSVLLKALARETEVESGQIEIGGVDLNDMETVAYRNRMGYVPQESFLFSMSLAENLALGNPAATEAELAEAVEQSRLSKDIEQLPEGFQTMVGERGLNLSGGQRQRASLARVLLTEPDLLLMDDPFSAVDTHTTEEILIELEPFLGRRTTLLVAHRVATVRAADQILVLDQGQVAERGSHAELLDLNGIYAALFHTQRTREALTEELDSSGEED